MWNPLLNGIDRTGFDASAAGGTFGRIDNRLRTRKADGVNRAHGGALRASGASRRVDINGRVPWVEPAEDPEAGH
jgi:hypothetical protein